jgi:hypothetical protein
MPKQSILPQVVVYFEFFIVKNTVRTIRAAERKGFLIGG